MLTLFLQFESITRSFLQTTPISLGERVILTESVKDLNQNNQDFASSLIFKLKTDSFVKPNHASYRKTDFQTKPTNWAESHTGNYHVSSISTSLRHCKILMINDLTLRRDPGINIPHSSESSILALDVTNVFPSVTDRILSPTWKDQLKSGSLPILERLLSKKSGSETALSPIVSGSFTRTHLKK